MYGLNIRRWNLNRETKSSILRTGQVSLQNTHSSHIESFQSTKVQAELKKPVQAIGAAFFTKFMELFCSVGNSNMNGSRVCAGFLPRESVRNARVFLNCSMYYFSREGA